MSEFFIDEDFPCNEFEFVSDYRYAHSVDPKSLKASVKITIPYLPLAVDEDTFQYSPKSDIFVYIWKHRILTTAVTVDYLVQILILAKITPRFPVIWPAKTDSTNCIPVSLKRLKDNVYSKR